MLELRNRISDLVFDALGMQGEFNSRNLAQQLLAGLTEDEASYLKEAHLTLMIKKFATQTKKEIEKNSAAQGLLDFPGINMAYTIKVVNERTGEEEQRVKKVELLTKAELEQIIQVRRESVANDMSHLNSLTHMLDELAPFWGNDPTLTIEQVAMIRKRQTELPLDGQAA